MPTLTRPRPPAPPTTPTMLVREQARRAGRKVMFVAVGFVVLIAFLLTYGDRINGKVDGYLDHTEPAPTTTVDILGNWVQAHPLPSGLLDND